MALFAGQFSLFLLFVSLLSSHARESQFFNKATATTTATTTNDVVPYTKKPETSPQQEQPAFLPDTENGHGLYDHEPSRLPPSSKTNPNQKHLPKNYNPVAYVTEPDDVNDRNSFTEDKNNFYGDARNYYITPQEKEPEYRDNYYNGGGGSSFNSRRENTFDHSGARQGMSDTRWVENGKYYYDIQAEKYNSNHPYESLKRSSVRTEYGNGENGYGVNGVKNSMEGYENQYEFQDEEDNKWGP